MKAAGIKGVCGKSSSLSSLGPVEKERRRLQHIFQQISEEKIVNKLLTNLSLDSATDITLIISLGKVFDKKCYPTKLCTKCRYCGEMYDPNYNNS